MGSEIQFDSIRNPSRELHTTSFENIFGDAMIDALKFIFGDSGSTIMYRLKLSQFVGDPAELHERMSSMLGMRVTLIIELRIINNLCAKLGGNFEIDHSRNDTFLEKNWKLAERAFKSLS